MKEVKDLRQKRNEELLDELDRLRAELILLRSRTGGAGMEKTALIRNTRKRIARILTILKERGIDL
ncbi:MAG: 50S ribosomal protein L29 [Thaumarchaeota archaeon]|nr:50S ribosomal protein L29 [Candidatus Geocrenenecus arthurdayi]